MEDFKVIYVYEMFESKDEIKIFILNSKIWVILHNI